MKLSSLLKKNTGRPAYEEARPEATESRSTDETSGIYGQGQKPGRPEQRPVELTALKDELTGVISALKQFVEGSESDFLLLDIGLRKVHANVSVLTDCMLSMVGQMAGEEKGDLLERSRNILNDSLAEIQVYTDRVTADLAGIDTVMENLEKLHDTSRQIKKFARSLKMVALAMLVESARGGDSATDIFVEVAGEVKRLSIEISDIANDVYKNVEEARSVHRATREEVSDGLRLLQTLTSEIRTTVENSTETLKLISGDIIEQAEKRSRDIFRQVEEIVVGVQFQDNMRQRIMYMIDQFEAMADTVTPATVPPDSPREGTDFRDGSATGSTGEPEISGTPLASAIREQAGRLDDIRIEVLDGYEKNQAALGTIGREVAELQQKLRDMSPDNGADTGNARSHNPFTHLKEALTQLHNLMARGKALYSRIEKAADQVTGIGNNLSELLHVVSGISGQTHNKAINSIISADRRGTRGNTLKQLSREMNDLATQSDTFSGEVTAIINTIVHLAGDIGREDMTRSAATGSDNSTLDRLTAILDDITRGHDNFRQDARAACARTGELKKAVDTTLTGLNFFTGLAGRLHRHQAHLIDIADRPGSESLAVMIKPEEAGYKPEPDNADQGDNIILFETDSPSFRKNHYDETSDGHAGILNSSSRTS